MRSSASLKLENIKTILQTNAARQLMFMIGIAVSVALGIVLFISIQEPTYRPLDYQLNQQNMGAIVDTLDKAGIQYKINDRDGVILVPAKDLELARIKLSASGVPKDDGFNYSFLNEQNNFANSQFIENARYLRALENDLSKTISSIEGVSAAKVHIAIPQNNIFADQNNKVTASIMLSVSPSFMSNKEKILSIMQIVADSVPGLDPKDVSITDQYGHFLSDGLGQNSIYSAQQLNYQNNMQNYYQKQIEAVLVPMLGENKLTVRVNANIDFTQQENAQEDYDPDKKAIVSEQQDDESQSSSGASGVPGALSNSAPSQGGSSGGTSNSGNSRNQSTKNYNVSKTVTYKKSNFASIKSLSVAVVVDNEMVLDPKTKQLVSKAVDPDKISKITELVKATIGFNKDRGDQVTVINSGFTAPKELPAISIHLWDLPWFWDVVKKIIGITLGFVFLFFIYKRMFSGQSSVNETTSNQKAQSKKSSGILEPDENTDQENSVVKMHELRQEGITRLKQLAVTEPSKVAGIIKNWVGK